MLRFGWMSFRSIVRGWAGEHAVAALLRASLDNEIHTCIHNVIVPTIMRRKRQDRRCQGTTWAVAPPADSRAHLFGASSRASWCRQPQTIAETRVPTVRRPSPRRRVAQPGLSRRIGADRTMGDAILSRDRLNDSWKRSERVAARHHNRTERTPAAYA